MSVDPRLGEREETPEEEALRVRHAELRLYGLTIDKLMAMEATPSPKEWKFIRAMDQKIGVFRQMPSAGEIEEINTLAWKYRRQMPRHLAPKLNPADPLVREAGL